MESSFSFYHVSTDFSVLHLPAYFYPFSDHCSYLVMWLCKAAAVFLARLVTAVVRDSVSVGDEPISLVFDLPK